MNANVGLILQIITAALQLAPVAVSTITSIKQLLAADPTVEEGMKAILDGTIEADDATIEMVRQWRAETQV